MRIAPPLKTRVWLRRHHLDELLARGESPAATRELARRADQLLPSRALTAAVPLQRREVLHARFDIERLAEELEAPEPVRIQGIARVELLLSDGASPIYSPSMSDVGLVVSRARDDLHVE